MKGQVQKEQKQGNFCKVSVVEARDFSSISGLYC